MQPPPAPKARVPIFKEISLGPPPRAAMSMTAAAATHSEATETMQKPVIKKRRPSAADYFDLPRESTNSSDPNRISSKGMEANSPPISARAGSSRGLIGVAGEHGFVAPAAATYGSYGSVAIALQPPPAPKARVPAFKEISLGPPPRAPASVIAAAHSEAAATLPRKNDEKKRPVLGTMDTGTTTMTAANRSDDVHSSNNRENSSTSAPTIVALHNALEANPGGINLSDPSISANGDTSRTSALTDGNEIPMFPPSWRQVPSKSRPGCFSYLHLPTGLRQIALPTREPTEEEIKKFIEIQKANKRSSGSGSDDAVRTKRRKVAMPMMKHKATADWQKFLKKGKKKL